MTALSKAQKSSVQAIVLAAGHGKRMKSSLPKVLHSVLGKPILDRVLAAVDALSLDHIHVVLGNGAEAVSQHLAANPPATPWSWHLQEPLAGTGHAVQQVVPALSSFQGTLLVTVGDVPLLTAGTLSQLIDLHRREKAVVTMLTTIVDDAKSYGRVVRDRSVPGISEPSTSKTSTGGSASEYSPNAYGKVLRIVEDKDATADEKAIKEINAAIYCLEWPQVQAGLAGLTNNNRQKEYYLTDLIAWAIEHKHPVSAMVVDDWQEVAGINSRIELSEATRILNQRHIKELSLECGVTIIDPLNTWIAPEVKIGADTTIMPGCFLTGEIEIGENCQIGPHTVMSGAVTIGNRTTIMQSLLVNTQVGDDCRIGPFAHIRESSIVADACRIGNIVEVKKSTIGDHTSISHLSYIGDATIGRRVNIGAGTITANYDHLSKQKQKTSVGDDASTGCNSVLVAPVSVGDSVVVAAGTVITKDVPAGVLVIGRAKQEIKPGWVENKKRQLKDKTPV